MGTTEKATNIIFSAGEIFPQGEVLEQLANRRLLLWTPAGEPVIGSRVCHADQLYESAPLDGSLQQALRFPTHLEAFGTAAELVEELTMECGGETGGDDSGRLLAAFVLATWLSDCLPGLPPLNLWGPALAIDRTVSVLSCLCRRALPIAVPALAELSRLPRGLDPTLILRLESDRSLQSLLAVTGYCNPGVLHKGRLLQLRCPLIVCTREPQQVPALSVPLLPTSRCRPIGPATAERLADRFQPRLLDFRLRRHQQVSGSEFDVADFASETRMLAITLGSVFEGEPELQEQVVEALRRVDEGWKVIHAQDHAAIVLESLLVAIHEGRPEIYVNDVTEMTNALLLARQEKQVLSAKKVGAILRDKLGLYAKRCGAGYALTLDNQRCGRIHQLAASRHALSTLQPLLYCPLCELYYPAAEADMPTDEQVSVHNVHEVHGVQEGDDFDVLADVHDVHDVQDIHDPDVLAKVREAHYVRDIHGVDADAEATETATGQEGEGS